MIFTHPLLICWLHFNKSLSQQGGWGLPLHQTNSNTVSALEAGVLRPGEVEQDEGEGGAQEDDRQVALPRRLVLAVGAAPLPSLWTTNAVKTDWQLTTLQNMILGSFDPCFIFVRPLLAGTVWPGGKCSPHLRRLPGPGCRDPGPCLRAVHQPVRTPPPPPPRPCNTRARSPAASDCCPHRPAPAAAQSVLQRPHRVKYFNIDHRQNHERNNS